MSTPIITPIFDELVAELGDPFATDPDLTAATELHTEAKIELSKVAEIQVNPLQRSKHEALHRDPNDN